VARRGRRKNELAKTAATTALALTGHAPVAAALKLAGQAIAGYRDRRVETMWSHVVAGLDEPLEFTERVADALLRDGDALGEAFIAAATAAANAVAPSVVPSIGLLARRFITDQVPHRRLYRVTLTMLQQLDDYEFGCLRDAMHTLIELPDDAGRYSTIVHRDNPDSEWQWYCRNTKPGTILVHGATAPALARAIGPLLDEPPDGELAADGRSPNKPFIPKGLVGLLVSIMPVDE
jgi:hypothetical protein